MIDSEDANRFFYNSVLSSLGLPPMTPRQETYAFMATSRDALLSMTPVWLHDKLDSAIAQGVNYNRDVLPRTRLMPGFREFVLVAHGLGIKLAIATNRTQEGIKRILDFFNLPNYFEPVISASTALPKPAPDGVRMICQSWGVSPDQTLFIGDSESDRGAANNAGAIFCAFGNHVKGEIAFESFSSLEHYLWPTLANRE